MLIEGDGDGEDEEYDHVKQWDGGRAYVAHYDELGDDLKMRSG